MGGSLGGGVYNNANQMNNLTVFSDPERRASNNYFWNPQNYITFSQSIPPLAVAAIPPINVVYISPDRVNAYNVQWSASVQRQLSESTVLEIALCRQPGVASRQQPQPKRCASGIRAASAEPAVSALGHDPLSGERRKVVLPIAAIRAERRFSRGFSFLASYTWAHNIDQAYGTNESLPFTPGGVQNQNCFACERANSGFDYRHRFTTSYLWNIPLRREWRGPSGTCLKNWSFNGIVTYQTGFPVHRHPIGQPQNTGSATQRPDYVPGPES